MHFETEKKMANRAFLDGDMLYTYNEDEEIIAYTKEMKEKWKSKLPYEMDSPMVMTDDLIIVNFITNQGEESYIEALDKKTGQSKYKIDLTEYNGISALLVEDDMLYVFLGESTDPEDKIFSDKYSLHKYSVKDGKLIWEKEINEFAESSYGYLEQLSYKDGLLYYVSDDFQLHALDMDTGDEKWTQQLPDFLGFSTAFVSDSAVHILDMDYTFHGYDLQTGEHITEYAFPGKMIHPIVQPVFKDNTVIYINLTDDESQLIAGDTQSEEELWVLDLEENYIFGLWLVDDSLYVLTSSDDEDSEEPSRIIKLNPDSGEIIEAIELSERMHKGSNYSYANNFVTDGYIGLFYEKSWYLIK